MTATHTVVRVLDASTPSAGLPPRDVTAFYIGGDTPHVWSPAEIALYAPAGKLPIWVRSNPNGAAQGAHEGELVRRWLEGRGAPYGCLVALDLETAIDRGYVDAFNIAVHPYACLKYGSDSTIWQNPETSGGTWLADPTGTPHQDARAVLTQYAFHNAYDMSLGTDDPNHPYWGRTVAPIGVGTDNPEEPKMVIIKPGEEGVPVSFPGGSAKGIGAVSDFTLTMQGPPILRIAVHSISKGYSQIELRTLDEHVKTTLGFHETDVDWISISREDTGTALVSVDWH